MDYCWEQEMRHSQRGEHDRQLRLGGIDQFFKDLLVDAMIALHNFPFSFLPASACRPPARPQASPAPGRRSLPFRAGRPKHFISAGGVVSLLPPKQRILSRGKRRHAALQLRACFIPLACSSTSSPVNPIPIPSCFPHPPKTIACCCVRPRHFYFWGQEQEQEQEEFLLRLPPRR